MAVSKVVYDGDTLIDLTADTVTEESLEEGVTAHDAAGNPITGIARRITVESELSSTSENPVQNKVINNALSDKSPTSHRHSGETITPNGIEIVSDSSSSHGGYIDFHFNGSSEDYTSRILETAAGLLALNQGGRVTLGTIANPTEVLRTLLNPTNHGYITDFNTGNGAVPGLWRVYNADGTAAHAPYSGAVGGVCLVVVIYDSNGAVSRVYQLLMDSYGDVYYKVITAGSGYGTWKKLTN